MKAPAWWAIVFFVMGAVTVGLWSEGRRREDMGRWKAERETLEARIAARADTVRVTDSVYAVDSSAFRSYATRYYAMKRKADSLARLSPDNHVPDSVTSVPDLGTVLTFCDSTVTIAEKALASCAARVRAGDSLLAATRDLLAHEQKKPGPRIAALAFQGGHAWDSRPKASGPFIGMEGQAGTRVSGHARISKVFADSGSTRLEVFGNVEF